MSDRKKIFITEDEFIVSKNLQYKLEELGYNVTGTAPSGEMAINLIRKNPPDLVLMDIMLAGDMDGIDTATKIREEFDIPIIFLTAYSSEEITKRASLADPYAYILKPYEERELEINISIALFKTEAEKKIVKKQNELVELNNKLDSLIKEKVEFSKNLIAIQEEEKKRIAKNLHDNIEQSVLAAKKAFNSLESALKTSEEKETFKLGNSLLDTIATSIKEISQDLMPE